MRRGCLILILLLATVAPASAQAWKQGFVDALKNGSVLVESDQGETLLSYRPDDAFMPASTLKIATSACAIDGLGSNYRFPTEFLQAKDNDLIVKGYGDPFLVSEEFDLIAAELAQKGLKKIETLILDPSFFLTNPEVDGRSLSSNPYDALNGALVANFNTLYFEKRGTSIRSAEPQTPMTPMARDIARKYADGKHRVNLGRDPQKNLRYFGELLIEFLKKHGVSVAAKPVIKVEKTPPRAKRILLYRSSKTVEDLVREMLEFSTNFIANQLFFALGAERYHPPATTEKGQKAMRECLRNKIGWQNFEIYEGAGLSRNNRVTARQMMILLRKFEPHRNLLPLEKGLFRAKTGTLTGVNTLAGYFRHKDGRLIRFVILVNSHVPFDYKFKLAKMLYDGLNS